MVPSTAVPLHHPHLDVDRALRLGLVATVLVTVAVLAYGTVAAVESAPPIPTRVVAENGSLVYTGADIRAGKQLFQRSDLADFGSLYGNGAYFGPDWGTDYLHREAVLLGRFGVRDTAAALKANAYSNGVLTLTAAQARAYASILPVYRQLFLRGDARLGLGKDVVASAREATQLTAFISWIAWTQSAARPGHGYSYTNNWPYDPAAGNKPTHSLWVWTWASIAATLVLTAVVVLFYRRFVGRESSALASPAAVATAPTTPSQRATIKWFVLVPPLLLVQAGAGTLMAHNFAERGAFFGIHIANWLPYNVLHAWHLQLAIAWIAAAWLGAGLYLAPVVGAREPRGQRYLANVLWVAVVAVVVLSSIGIWFGVKGFLDGTWWFWLGDQGLEFIQLGRAFQIALLAGLLLWAFVLARAFWPALRERRAFGSLEGLLLFSGLAIGVVYGAGLLSRATSGATMTDYWRWWVIHLWVEGVFEFFTVVVTAYAVLTMGLLGRRLVERVVYFELILVFGSGIVGTGHHFYWAGEPAVWLALGAMFSMAEVVPLGFLMLRAWREYRAIRGAGGEFPHRTAFAFFTAAAFWNVTGAGLIGGLINPPIVSYYEHGTFLTLAHGHAAMFGSFGLLALGLMYMALTGLGLNAVQGRLAHWALWAFNGAIVLWLALNLLPVGVAQMADVVANGYWHARSLAFYDGWTVFQWLRLPGDVAFAAGGLIVLVDVVGRIRASRAGTAR